MGSYGCIWHIMTYCIPIISHGWPPATTPCTTKASENWTLLCLGLLNLLRLQLQVFLPHWHWSLLVLKILFVLNIAPTLYNLHTCKQIPPRILGLNCTGLPLGSPNVGILVIGGALYPTERMGLELGVSMGLPFLVPVYAYSYIIISIYIFILFHISLSNNPSIQPSVFSSIHLSIFLYLIQSIENYSHPSICLSASLCIFSIHPSDQIDLSICFRLLIHLMPIHDIGWLYTFKIVSFFCSSSESSLSLPVAHPNQVPLLPNMHIFVLDTIGKVNYRSWLVVLISTKGPA